jgi:hypothetical protein
MLIDEMHSEFDLRLDRTDVQDRPDFYDNERDSYLNRAIRHWVKERYGTDNKKKAGFETNQERISNLMSLHIRFPVQAALTPVNKGNGIYELQLSRLSFPYLFLTGASVTIKKGDCTHTIEHTAWQIDDRKNTYNEPSFTWKRVHANFGRASTSTTNNRELYSIYFDSNDGFGATQFEVTSVSLSYIKYPDRVCLGTYKHIDDKTTATTTAIAHCDVPLEFHDEIVNIAVELAQKEIQDQFGFQTSRIITESEK